MILHAAGEDRAFDLAGALSPLGIGVRVEALYAMPVARALPDEALSPRSRLILVYALCGFANFASLGIMVGGLVAMAPGRRADIVGLGFRSILAGTLATCMTGAVVGALTWPE